MTEDGTRQLIRLWDRYRIEGAQVLVHGNRAQRPTNALALGVVDRVVQLATSSYQGSNQLHLSPRWLPSVRDCSSPDPPSPSAASGRSGRLQDRTVSSGPSAVGSGWLRQGLS